ncbi:LEA type 2 family protein [Azomonas macrocytogenes]|uniref:LEA14-like dessication related protein n=1 Tax=Azomonas macrocytogenes TaxID=69962 RepID=A0A839T3H4_AZOMA|nr:LEA type 2 family protein [Azomonas macrocytogenes]MBB3103962.1 LEA14-like dessication related protein [Azomonas macrocytogenes]
MLAMLQKRLLKTWLLLGLLLCLPGCSGWLSGRFENPNVELTDVDVIKARLLDQEFLLRFRIDNPNDRSLPIRGLNYVVRLGEVKLASGETDSWAYIPANGHAFYEVPVHTSLWKDLKHLVRQLEKPKQPIRYTLDGELKTGLMFRRQVPISRSGEITPGKFIPK